MCMCYVCACKCKCTHMSMDSYYLQLYLPREAEQRSWWGSGMRLRCPHTSSEYLSLLDTGGNTHTHTWIQTTLLLSVTMSVSLTGDLMSPLVCISCRFMNYSGISDVINAHSVCADGFLCMLHINVWVYFGTCNCRCDRGSIGEGLCWWARAVGVQCCFGQDWTLETHRARIRPQQRILNTTDINISKRHWW